MHNAGTLRVDRVKHGSKVLYVPSAFVAITGGIQPKVLRWALTPEYFASGLAARILLAMPPREPRRWRDDVVPAGVREKMHKVFEILWTLETGTDQDGNPQPVDIGMTPAAKARFVRFVNEHGQEQYDTTSGDLAAVWSKLEATVARLALIFHLVRWASGEVIDVDAVGEIDIEAAIAMVEWFGSEARRVYAVLSETEEDEARRELVELITRMGGEVSARDLQRASRKFPSAEDAEAALLHLIDQNLGDWRVDNHDGGPGRPVAVFRLHDMPTADTNSVFSQETPIVSAPAEANGDGIAPWDCQSQ